MVWLEPQGKGKMILTSYSYFIASGSLYTWGKGSRGRLGHSDHASK